MKPLSKLFRLPAHLNRLARQGMEGDWSLHLHKPAVRILAAYSTPDTELLTDGSLDVTPTRLSAFRVPLAGWVVPRSGSVKGISILCNEYEVASAALEIARPDVAHHLNNLPGAEQSGFRAEVKTLGLDAHFTLDIYALLDDDRRALLGRVECSQELLRPAYKPELNPILVTFIGRTGSTWLMRLLSEHPQIVIDTRYPYETRPLLYWLHVLRVLSAPADHKRSTYPTHFTENEYWVGHNPFFTPDTLDDDALLYWMGQKSVQHLASLCLLNVDRFYRHLKRRQERKKAIYFAEKSVYSTTSRLAWQLYPKPREIVLVRDPRDVFASVQSFNAKRGTQGFKSDLHSTPEAYLHFLNLITTRQARIHRANPDQTYLLHYEDLILHPQETLEAVFRYLKVEAAPGVIAEVIRRASQDTPEMQQHRTTTSPASSIGRWRHDLTPEMQATAAAVLGNILAELNYPLS
jgi:hypothetical protein